MRPSQTQNDNMEAVIHGSLGDVAKGEPGKSAYELAVEHGYEGSEEEWLSYVQANADRAVSAENAAVAAKEAAQYASDEAQGHAESASTSAGVAHTEAEAAAESAAQAEAAAVPAGESRDGAAMSAADAADSATAAAASATEAASQALLATGRADEARQSQIDAHVSEVHCEEMWLAFKRSPDIARQYAEAAAQSAEAAEQSEDAAEGYKDDTEGLKLEIVGYRNETGRLCSVTGYYASQADASATAAAASATAAAGSATAAAGSATQAEAAVTRAVTEAVTAAQTAVQSQIDSKLDVNGKAVSAGNADTVNNHTVLSDVPANAVFTDTTYQQMTDQELEDGISTQGRVVAANTIATFILNVIADVINSAPAALDTLEELAAAINDDPDFHVTVMNEIGKKLDKAGGVVTGNLTVNGTLTADVTGNADTATKLATARTINIQDSTATNTGTGASFDGSGNATIKLPATINANITGNVTGNVSGSSGSCTGNAATATSAAACTGNAATSTLLYQNDQTAGFKQIAYADYGVNSCGSLRLAFDASDGSANNDTGKFDIDVKGARSKVAVRQFTDWEHYVREATLLDPAGNTYFPGQVLGHRLRGYGGHVAANAMFDNGGIVLLEKDGVGSTQTDFTYAPSIGFHWQNVAGGSLSFHRDTNFYFRKQDGVTRATVDANLNGNAATATKINGKTIPVVSSFDSSTGTLALTSLS